MLCAFTLKHFLEDKINTPARRYYQFPVYRKRLGKETRTAQGHVRSSPLDKEPLIVRMCHSLLFPGRWYHLLLVLYTVGGRSRQQGQRGNMFKLPGLGKEPFTV